MSGQWVPELVWVAVVATLAIANPGTQVKFSDPASLALPLTLVGTAALYRKLPAAALGITWLAGIAQVGLALPLTLAQVAVVPVAYGCARYGSRWTAAAAAFSMPVAAALGAYYVNWGTEYVVSYQLFDLLDLNPDRLDVLTLFGAVAALTMLIPWLVGMLMRAIARSKRAETARDEAQARAALTQEIADLREAQASLARDVHDVVGHSLAVILAQAQSAEFFADDTARLQSTLETIATSARASLADIRHVLEDTGSGSSGVADSAFSDLVAGIRAAGREVAVTDEGAARSLPPDLQVVAHRVAQEMLTNAVRHGEASAPIEVTRSWSDTLCVQVRNKTAEQGLPHLPGSGIEGMRRRLEAVGGTITTVREGTSFVATAWMPTGGLR